MVCMMFVTERDKVVIDGILSLLVELAFDALLDYMIVEFSGFALLLENKKHLSKRFVAALDFSNSDFCAFH